MTSLQHIRLRDGRFLSYRECGDLEGLPVIYNHGGTVSCLDVLTADEAARNLNIRFIAPNRPGIGSSSYCHHRTMRQWAIDCCDLAEALELERFGSFGLSMGGQYALALAAFLPERVSAVVVSAGAIPLDQHRARQELNRPDRMLTWLCRHCSPIAAALFFLAGLLARWAPRRSIGLWKSQLSADDARVMGAFPATFLARCLSEAMQQPQGMVEEYRAWARPWGFVYDNIHCPATIFRGTSDQLIPRSWSEQMARALPQGVFQEVPNAGHLFPITDWQRVLRPFLT